MNEVKSYKRFPAIRCWIKHVLEGKFSYEDKTLFTIFGKVKRVRIVATIYEKRELLVGEENRIEFDLDDGTGLIRAILWAVKPEQYAMFNKGDNVDLVGLIRYWNGFTSISPEIIKKIEEPNLILLRDAEIIKKIKAGEIQEIPDISVDGSIINERTSEIDIMDQFEENRDLSVEDDKERLFLEIKEHSKNGIGISLNDLKETMRISDDILRSYLRDLEVESRIYQSEENIFQTFD